MRRDHASTHTRLLSLALAAGGAIAWAPAAHAQPERTQHTQISPSLRFEQEQLPLSAVAGNIHLRADRAWVWKEANTHRIVLERDVQVELGGVQFNAERAVIWLRRISDADAEPVYQVFAYLEDVGTPAADAAVSLEAGQLPVRAVVRATPTLTTDLRLPGPPSASSTPTPARQTLDALSSAIEALDRAFTNQRSPIEPPKPEPTKPGPTEPGPIHPNSETEPDTTGKPVITEPGNEPTPTGETTGQMLPLEPGTQQDTLTTPTTPTRSPIFRAEGIFYIAAGDRVVVQSGEAENSVLITGGLVVQYQSGTDSLEMTAQRGVVFLKPGKLTDQLAAFNAEDVIGVYLEGEVRATNGQYTLRGPRVYYDVQADRALVLDAIFWTYEKRLGMPLYMRADAIRQEAANEFTAKKASLSNTAFFHPDFTIGVSSITLTQKQDKAGESEVVMDARNITMRAGSVPFFWWPRYKGNPERIPIRNIGFKDSNRTGAVIQTKWDAFTLLGIDPPEDIDALLMIDNYSDRGFGLGIDANWSTEKSSGNFYAYALPNDNGTDVVARRVEIDREDEARSMAFFRHRQELPDGWTILAEAAYASDEAFVPALFPRIGRETRELTTRLYARKNNENTQLSIEAKAAVNDFIIPEHRLQTPGYLVDKLPELKYTSIGNDLFPDTFPGLITHTWEASYAQMRLRFSEVDAASLGFTNNTSAQRAFGTNSDQSLGDLFRATGLDEGFVNRFDTRHELSAQLKAGQLLITPFAVARLTIYDDGFQSFSPNETDTMRLWGGIGTTIATSFNRVNRDIESDLFDIHGLRHIVEPSVTIFHSDTTIDRENLPVFDDEVESLLEGTSLNLRLANTWQTKRGGPGRWRSVDLLRLNIEYTWNSGDTGLETPIGRYYASRPELSVPGEYFRLDSTLQLTDALAVAGETIYDLNINQQARSSIGILIEHTPDFLTTAELRYLNSQNVTYGRLGLLYKLTSKYRVSLTTTYNFQREDFQNFNTRFYRRFTIGELGIGILYDNIRGETSFGITFTPIGVPGGRIGGPVNNSSAFQQGFGG
jgi:hypothetical protein